MCINKEVSISGFIICSVSCFYLYKRNKLNDRWIAILFGYIGTMQFLEYLMWIDQECSGLNQMATNVGFIHNILQPIISLGVAYYFTNGKLPMFVYAGVLLYIFTSLPFIIQAKENNQCSLPCNGTTDGLSWNYSETKYKSYVWFIFLIAVTIPFMGMKKNRYIYIGFIILTYIGAHFISINRCPNRITSPNGSWWCLMAVFVPLLSIWIN